MKKKPYDILDPRCPEFEVDYEEFKSHVNDILVSAFCFLICKLPAVTAINVR